MVQVNLFTNRNRVTDVENNLMVTRRMGGMDKQEIRINICTLLYVNNSLRVVENSLFACVN